jgi:hypothetical protein
MLVLLQGIFFILQVYWNRVYFELYEWDYTFLSVILFQIYDVLMLF